MDKCFDCEFCKFDTIDNAYYCIIIPHMFMEALESIRLNKMNVGTETLNAFVEIEKIYKTDSFSSLPNIFNIFFIYHCSKDIINEVSENFTDIVKQFPRKNKAGKEITFDEYILTRPVITKNELTDNDQDIFKTTSEIRVLSDGVKFPFFRTVYDKYIYYAELVKSVNCIL